MTQKLILDVDTGADDAVAMLLAGHHPDLTLAAVTVTHGNGPLPITLENTLRVLAAGQLGHVPVYAGAASALVAESIIPTFEGQDELLPLPPTALAPQRQHAVNFLIDYYLSPAGPETVYVPVGPQTNLALALRLEPRLAGRIPGIVTMAGAYLEGNTTPSAEFNVLADPEAARIVFTAGIPIRMVGLEATHQALVHLQDVDRIAACESPWARLAADLLYPQVHWFIEHEAREGGEIFDAVAVAALADPALLITRPMHVDIELGGQFTRGRIVADISGRHPQAPNVAVGVGVDRDRFIQILSEGLGRSAS